MSNITYTGKPIDFIKNWNAFRKSLPPCLKTSTNPHFKSRFTPLDVWITNSLVACEAANVALIESTRIQQVGDDLWQYHVIDIVTEFGSLTSEYLVSATDKPQAAGSALTYARRYHIQTLLGATGEDDDDAEVAQAAPRTAVTMGTARARRGTVA